MSAQTTRITWLGHSAVLIETGAGTNLLIDPYLSVSPVYPAGFELPKKLDGILLTHGHGDHSLDARELSSRYGAPIVAMHELALYMAGKGVKATIGMALGGTVRVGDVQISMVDARHSSSVEDEEGVHYAGVAAGLVLTVDGGPVLYHAGDTTFFGDMKLIGEFYRPTVAMLPIGGHYTMGPREAAVAVDLLKPKTVLPLHFGTFPPLTGRPEELAALVEPAVKVVAWKPGESFSL